MPPRRSYDQYCSAARALDLVGDRWTLLIVRELLAGPRRYTDLHADLPGVSTDVLASRLKDMERDGLATRRRLPPPGAAMVYELTPRGGALLPVLQAFGAWGEAELGERRPTDAVRAHWFALPLLRALAGLGVRGLVEVHLEEGDFHVRAGGEPGDSAPADSKPVYAAPVYGDGPAPTPADARLILTTPVSEAVARGTLPLLEALRAGQVTVEGEGPVAKALREV
ncbi:transcriptional regulator [Streptomyces sp. SID685]|uniref:winged helix-turn-helix transcriptional regulator n=1 Tax=Streptomyces sp. SID685 TaxID=2690322 RepID=UPI00136FF0DA|nr:helix-turn-helix domain-containing protein [Streptomyces sp. SID685]MYR91788.1 transcriptional regulator [Streptomyces sp. SID685]